MSEWPLAKRYGLTTASTLASRSKPSFPMGSRRRGSPKLRSRHAMKCFTSTGRLRGKSSCAPPALCTRRGIGSCLRRWPSGDRGKAPSVLLAGDGPLATEIATAVEDRGLGDRVRVLPAHWPTRKSSISCAFVTLSYCLPPTKGVPVAVAEASAVAATVVATRVGGIPDLVEDGVSGSWSRPRTHRQPRGGALGCPGGWVPAAGLGKRTRRLARSRVAAIATRWHGVTRRSMRGLETDPTASRANTKRFRRPLLKRDLCWNPSSLRIRLVSATKSGGSTSRVGRAPNLTRSPPPVSWTTWRMTSRTAIGTPEPMLIAPLKSLFTRSPRPRATSSTWRKSRFWRPSVHSAGSE